MFQNIILDIFERSWILGGVIAPIVLIQLFSLVFIASLLQPGVKPRTVAYALYCYLVMGVGVLLMTIAVLPTLASVLAGMSYSAASYFALLVTFAIGGGLYLVHDARSQKIDNASKTIPSLIFFFSVHLIGVLVIVISSLSFVLTLILGSSESGWWVMPLTIIMYGVFLLWTTNLRTFGSSIFQSIPLSAGFMQKPTLARVIAKKSSVGKFVKAAKAKKKAGKKHRK